MTFLLITILLFLTEIFYFRIANHFNIIDKPNERSLHSTITNWGGGIVFWVAGLVYFIYLDFFIFLRALPYWLL